MVVTLALTAALCFALASVLQHQVAVSAPAKHSLRVGLLTHLVRRPQWLAGVAADGVGYLLQVLALDRGALTLVQPLLAAGLLFALIFNARSGNRGLRRRDWGAASIAAAGLAVFVVAGAPRQGVFGFNDQEWVTFGVATAVIVLATVVLAGRRGPAGKAALLAAGAGITFGLSAALTKQSLHEFHHGFVHLLATGYPYGLAAAGVAGMLLAQSAFQAGALAASLPTLTLSEPVFATIAGALLFGEHVRSGAAGGLALFGAALAAAAVVFLARSPSAQPVIIA